jgi:hypothetical protein
MDGEDRTVSDDFVISEPGEYRIESPKLAIDAEEWAKVCRDLQAISECAHRLAVLWADVVVSFQHAWVNDPIVGKALADLRSNDGRSRKSPDS